MTANTMTLSCTCGGRIVMSVDPIYTSRLQTERVAFDQAHQVCREAAARPPKPDPEWTAERRICDPPERPESLPDPVVPDTGGYRP